MYDENLILHLLGEQMPRSDTSAHQDGVGQCPHGPRPLAMVYSPVQEWRDLYENEVGHDRGTIFKELDFPFLGGAYRD